MAAQAPVPTQEPVEHAPLTIRKRAATSYQTAVATPAPVVVATTPRQSGGRGSVAIGILIALAIFLIVKLHPFSGESIHAPQTQASVPPSVNAPTQQRPSGPEN